MLDMCLEVGPIGRLRIPSSVTKCNAFFDFGFDFLLVKFDCVRLFFPLDLFEAGVLAGLCNDPPAFGDRRLSIEFGNWLQGEFFH